MVRWLRRAALRILAYASACGAATGIMSTGLGAFALISVGATIEPGFMAQAASFGLLVASAIGLVAVLPTLLAWVVLRRSGGTSRRAYAAAGSGVALVLFGGVVVPAAVAEPGVGEADASIVFLLAVTGPLTLVAGIAAGLVCRTVLRSTGVAAIGPRE